MALAIEDYEFSDSVSLHERRLAAGNPNTPEKILINLSVDTVHSVRLRVAENPCTPEEVLKRLSRDGHADVRLAVSENHNTPESVLAILAKDEDADVRYGMAENQHMSETVLLILSEDDNPYVRCRAMKTLQNLAPEIKARMNLKLNSKADKRSVK